MKQRFGGIHSDHEALQIDFHLLNTSVLKKKREKSESKLQKQSTNMH